MLIKLSYGVLPEDVVAFDTLCKIDIQLLIFLNIEQICEHVQCSVHVRKICQRFFKIRSFTTYERKHTQTCL
jgi:hypothetical protein